MARTKVPLQSQFPYHVSARCINRERFEIPMPHVWEIMTNQLYFVQQAFGVRVTAFVLMTNHFHLIVQTPDSNLDLVMRWFMRETSLSLNRAGSRINQTYGSRFFRSMIATDLYLLHAYKYVYLNPVRAGLAESVLDYQYSSLPGVLGLQPLPFAVHDDILLPAVEETLEWLDLTPDQKNWESVRKALRRKVFQLGKVQKKDNPLEIERF